ncbi:3,4-dihydroxy-2-butanone-4-phosphate synthase [Tersicoccus sp. Bi-70]|uniref:3,4-dihydroxy-2-butanone-4-phosphate synthase n=1 Tax=Tersicoccus sp. Bi-70 TaxID=1897634 RepID=UPI000976FA35|nr:3,4-dihydroxy-2-butanone-4-phosphate synthase [Tersicoccus sp. Bi-70]OMH33126.1 3,4-dihydroxy-2-butanone-4-phosphate synthase [Tersicoccus sp. Bi-70]
MSGVTTPASADASAATGETTIAATTAAAGAVTLDPIEAALTALRAGRPVVVVDDEDRENEGDIIFPAERADAALMGFTVRYTSGVICVPLTAERAAQLALPPMLAVNEDPKGTAYTVSTDAASGVSTGISAADRARTATVLADPAATAGDLTRPGHVFPLIAVDGLLDVRPGHTEAAVALCLATGHRPVGVIAELVHDDGSMMRLPALRAFADEHDLRLISIADLIVHLGRHPLEDGGGTEPISTDRTTTDPSTTDFSTDSTLREDSR